MKKLLRYIIGFLVLISCTNQQIEIKEETNDVQLVAQDSLELQLLESYYDSKITEPFQVSEISKLQFTSGGGESVINNDYCNEIKEGAFGSYFLIDPNFSDEKGRPVGGIITVHYNDNEKGWKADDTSQTIWKIHLKSDVISVWNSIRVGMARSQIEKFGKENNGFCFKKGDIFYSCDFNNFSAVYIFQNDTLKELTVTRKCENEKNSNFKVVNSLTEGCDFSKKYREILKVLQQDDYNIDSTLNQDTLKFQIRDRFKVVKSYDFDANNFKFVFAKRKTRLERMDDKWFPSFRVYEICFDSEQTAIKYETILNEVLSSKDIFNDKNYDYLIRNSDRIIYVSCGAKIFEEYAFQYRDTIKKIINN